MEDLNKMDSKYVDADGYIRYEDAMFVNILLSERELIALQKKTEATNQRRRETYASLLRRSTLKALDSKLAPASVRLKRGRDTQSLHLCNSWVVVHVRTRWLIVFCVPLSVGWRHWRVWVCAW